jgi:hypothetical protein
MKIIRRVIKVGRDGRPKSAMDSKARIHVERVKAFKTHVCAYRDCALGHGYIEAGVEYAKVTNFNLGGRRIGRYNFPPEPNDYHFECLPPDARPLLRFFRA